MSSLSDCSSPRPKKFWFKAALPYLIFTNYIASYDKEEDYDDNDDDDDDYDDYDDYDDV